MCKSTITTSNDAAGADVEIVTTIVLSVRIIPVKRTAAIPTFLEVDDKLQIARLVRCPYPNMTGKCIQIRAEFDAQVAINNEIVWEVVQDPMTYGCERSYSNDPAIVIIAIDSPFETR